MKRVLALAAAAFLCGCKPSAEPGVLLLTTAEASIAAATLEFIADPTLRHQVVSNPRRDDRAGFVIAVVGRTDCTDCYRLEGDGQRLTVTGGIPLGVQYGVAHALELFGYRFPHPWHTVIPAAPTPADPSALGKEYGPQIGKRRGLHLHTLHPIEGLYDFWNPGEANLEGARRTIDFLVKNRGNYLQWCALDNITDDPAAAAAWKAHTQAIVADAHRRGVKVGAAIQLFGKSNLQNAFDLIDEEQNAVPELKRRLHVLLDEVGFDALNLSFGEFSGADPAAFVQQVNTVYDSVQQVSPGVELMATIHVGNYPNLMVTYEGRTQLYYFLIRYANPAITPWVHSVMYFNLYEDTGGAYLHDAFTDHREYLEERLRAKQPVGYFPESAYWIAFDNALPTYVPLYMRSRFLDLQKLKAAGALQDHVLFSSGWEWGYWQTDATVLRMNYTLPATWDVPVREFFAAYGEKGKQLGALIARLGETQHAGLIGKRLAAYLAGRDQLIDAGEKLGIVSQPDRVEFDEVSTMAPAARAAFVTATIDPLGKFADEQTAIDAELKALALGDEDRFLSEMNDGFDITARRGRYIHALYRATVAYADGGSDAGWLAKAEGELEGARLTVARRRKRLHDPDPKLILRNNPNPTFYKYGYLRDADSLCFWERERAQARRIILQTGDEVPGCVL